MGDLSPEARTALEKRPVFEPQFLEQQAQKFGLPVDQVQEMVAEVLREGGPALVVEQRQFGVDEEAREHFRKLYQEEIRKRRTCNRWIVEPGTQGKKVKRPCGSTFESIEQALVHHSIHLLYEADYRTQRAIWNDIKDLLHPMTEKSLRAALSVDERRRMMQDHRLRARLLGRVDQ